jgi:asparagine synthase (glutamine-hydrolysing)
MAHSLETRHPMLDHRLVDFAVSLPTDAKIRHGWTKYLLRDAFPELPSSIRWRRDKQGFTTPEESWLKHDFSTNIRESFRHSTLGQMGLIKDADFLNLYSEFQRGKAVPCLFISRVFVAESWARRFFGLRSAVA